MSSLVSCLPTSEDVQHVQEVVTYDPPTLPDKHYDPDTTEPISYSLSSLEELLSWQKSHANPFNVATVSLAKRHPSLESSQSRTLVCHDMMGGYLEDRFIQGAEVETPFCFYHWSYIDIFNYFSHRLVTIPPAVWINAAHKHAVSVLGTFITEWTEGKSICETFLQSEDSYRSVADQLVDIADCYGFEGWLINIENNLSETAVKNMPAFLRYLRQQTRARISGGLLLWYDSVLQDGELKWQNELNSRNSVFFQACDGIYTNYNWTEDVLERMKGLPEARGRCADIYVGVDVFARGEVVGGKFETSKALELIRKHSFSAAIFAPGWVYECHDKKDFRTNQDRFWALLSDFLSVHRPSLHLPFSSSFCQGFGKSFHWQGQVGHSTPWLNMSAQELQPLCFRQAMGDGGWVESRACPLQVWSGGNSLLLDGVLPATQNSLSAKILSLHIPLPSRTFISFIHKPSLGVVTSLELVITDDTTAVSCSCKEIRSVSTSSVQPQELADDHHLVKQFTQSCNVWLPEGWIKRCFLLDSSGCALWDISVLVIRQDSVSTQNVPFQCRIGEVMALDAESLSARPDTVRDMQLCDVVWQRVQQGLSLSATLRWHYPARRARHFQVHWRVDGRPGSLAGPTSPVGRAYKSVFRVCGLSVPPAPATLELLVEPVDWRGAGLPQEYWGRLKLSYTGGGSETNVL